MKKSGLADSPFFTPPTPPVETPKVASPIIYEAPERVNARTNERTNVGTHERTNGKNLKRCSFQLYPAQEIAINKLALEMSLKKGSHVEKSELVREAIDLYLKKVYDERPNE